MGSMDAARRAGSQLAASAAHKNRNRSQRRSHCVPFITSAYALVEGSTPESASRWPITGCINQLACQAEHNAYQCDGEAATQENAQNGSAIRAQRHAHANFARSLRHLIAEQSEEADHREHQRET